MHEWLHVCGFYHWPNNAARDDVAYNLGNIVRNLTKSDAKSLLAMPDWLDTGICDCTSRISNDNANELIDSKVQ